MVGSFGLREVGLDGWVSDFLVEGSEFGCVSSLHELRLCAGIGNETEIEHMVNMFPKEGI